jgi:type IV secretion system protein VirB1
VIAPAVLAGLISSCASSVDVRTAAAVVAVESGGSPYAVNDNDTRRSYFPTSRDAAEALVRRLAGHQLAVGIAQVDSVNFARFGVDAVQVLDPCTSLRLGAQVLVEDYRREYPRATGATEEERRQVALRRAFSAYNSGSPTAAPDYAALVVAATSSPLVREATAIADGRESGAVSRLARRAAPKPSEPLRVAYGPGTASSVFAGGRSRISGSAFVVEGAR